MQSLSEQISVSTEGSDSELAQIKAHIETIRNSAPENAFVQRLVSSVPAGALEAGVWTEPDLKERFRRVYPAIRRSDGPVAQARTRRQGGRRWASMVWTNRGRVAG